MILHDATTRCHSCARTFEVVVDDDLDSHLWEIPEPQRASCPYCGHEHVGGTAMEIITEQTAPLLNLFPADGVWLVNYKDGGAHRMTKLTGVPNPVGLAAIARHTDTISRAIVDSWQLYMQKGSQAPVEVAEAIVHALHQEMNEESQNGICPCCGERYFGTTAASSVQ